MALLEVLGLRRPSGAQPASTGGTKAKRGTAPSAAEEKQALTDRRQAFKRARAAWVATKRQAEADLEKVKDGARLQYLTDARQYPKIGKGCKDIDAILDNLDDELRDTLDKYASTSLNDQTRLHALAATASEVLDRYLAYVGSDPLLKAIDHKEFADVTVHAPIMKALTTLRKVLADT